MAYSRYARRRFGGRRVKRKVSLAKMKYGKSSASNQKQQIISNKQQITKIAKQIRQNRVYTDYFLTNEYTATGGWWATPLTNPGDWKPGLRTSETVVDSVSTHLLSCQIYLSLYNKGPGTSHVNVYLVSPANESADRNPFVTHPVIYTEYVASLDGSQCISINRDVFKIRHHKSLMLTTVNPGEGLMTPAPVQYPGDPRTTYYKWATGYKTNYRLIAPTGLVDAGGVYKPQTWKTMQIEQLPYHRRVYLMIHCVTENAGGVELYWHQHSVCVNTD